MCIHMCFADKGASSLFYVFISMIHKEAQLNLYREGEISTLQLLR